MVRMILLGDEGVGKTTFFNTYVTATLSIIDLLLSSLLSSPSTGSRSPSTAQPRVMKATQEFAPGLWLQEDWTSMSSCMTLYPKLWLPRITWRVGRQWGGRKRERERERKRGREREREREA
jgi:hypothetical protein